MAYADVSLASTSVSNPVFGSPTTFFFSSPYATTGTNDQSARNSESATSALGSANSATGPGAAQGGEASGGAVSAPSAVGSTILGLPPWALYAGAGVGVLVLIGAVWFIAKRR